MEKLKDAGVNQQRIALGSNIRQLRKMRGWTILDLAGRVESDVGNISRLERGLQGYSDDLITRIASALEVTLSSLFDSSANINVTPAVIGSRKVPLISYVQDGMMTEAINIYAVGDAAEYLLTDLDLSGNAFALEIRGESMLPDFKEGDRIILDPAIEPRPGDFVVAKNGDHEATFKKYRPRGINKDGETIFELVPLNEDYAPINSDITPVQIIATMVEHRRYRKS